VKRIDRLTVKRCAALPTWGRGATDDRLPFQVFRIAESIFYLTEDCSRIPKAVKASAAFRAAPAAPADGCCPRGSRSLTLCD
jgi:hypothetical protein